MDDLQRIVDSLGRATGRAVAIQDRHGRMVAYNAHEGPVDDVRKAAILTRRGPDRPRAWTMSFGIETAVEPVRIPANADLGMQPRVCAPIRYEGSLLGYLWLVDPEATLPEDALSLVASSADSAGMVMHAEELRGELERGRERDLLRELLGDNDGEHEHAANELLDARLFIPQDEVVAVVARPVRGREVMAAHDTGARARLEHAVRRARDQAASRRAVHIVRVDHAVLLLAVRRRDSSPLTLAMLLQEALADSLADEGFTAVVGIGDPREQVGEAAASYGEALRAAELGALDSSLGGVVAWSRVGIYKLLSELPLDRVDRSVLHPALERLLATRESASWLRTLEVYLDLAGDARATAAALNVQRGSLYHRLHRIEELAGVDLDNGSDRLALHLSLKVARLAGLLEGSG